MNRWDQKGVPHTSWEHQGVHDSGKNKRVCQMCGNEQVRFVHTVHHKDANLTMEVGCQCAGKMCGDTGEARRLDEVAKSRVGKFTRLLNSNRWKLSKNGNFYVNYKGHLGILFQRSRGWMFSIDRAESVSAYPSFAEAKQRMCYNLVKRAE